MEGKSGLFARIAGDSVIQRIGTMMHLPDVVGNEDFSRFMESACVAYLPAHDEMVFANEEFCYCYLYSLRYGTWTHVTAAIKGFVPGCPLSRMFFVDGEQTHVVRWSNDYAGENRVFLVTRPQLWGTKLPKRVMQLMLHAYSKPVEEKTAYTPSLACYMFGSNDGVNFCLLAGREVEKEIKDLKFPYFPTQSYRYYLFVVCGEMSADSWITGLEIEAEPAWNNRI